LLVFTCMFCLRHLWPFIVNYECHEFWVIFICFSASMLQCASINGSVLQCFPNNHHLFSERITHVFSSSACTSCHVMLCNFCFSQLRISISWPLSQKHSLLVCPVLWFTSHPLWCGSSYVYMQEVMMLKLLKLPCQRNSSQ